MGKRNTFPNPCIQHCTVRVRVILRIL